MRNEPQRRRDTEIKCFPILTFAFLLFAFNFSASAQDDTRVSATWQVLKYDISATLPAGGVGRDLTAAAKIDLKNVSARPAMTLTLRISPSAEVSTVKMDGSVLDFAKREEKIGSGSLQQVVIRIPPVQPNATVSVTVDYKLNVKDNSGLATISAPGAQFLPLSYWYPTPNSWYFARGADYAPTRLRVTAPGLSVVSSGTENSGTFESKVNGQPFFVSGSWDISNSSGVAVHSPKGAGPIEQKRAVEVADLASEAKTFLANILGDPPTEPIRLVSVDRGAGFSGGGTILLDESVFRRPKVDSQTAMNIAEGIAKVWLGGSASITGDGSGAIRDGLTRFLATQFLEAKYGKEVADVERLRQRVSYSAVALRDSPIKTVSPLDDFYYSVVANKGAMIWRLLAKKVGNNEFDTKLKTALKNGVLNLDDLRTAYPNQKEFLDYAFEQSTDMDLLVGLPQQSGSEWKVALRNTGSIDVTVDVDALLDNGERLTSPATIRAKSFGEIIFKSPNKIRQVEIDSQKLYPQTDFSDDVAPREYSESDPLLAVKKFFDKQEFANAEISARKVLSKYPEFDDVRVLLARSLLSLNRPDDAEREFKAVLEEKLPASRSIGWALVGLADVAQRRNQSSEALRFVAQAIASDSEYGASLAARAIRNKIGARSNPDDSITSFFGRFDAAAAANQKAQLESLVLPGEASRFTSGVAGQTVAWKTVVKYVDMIGPNTALVETDLNIKLLNREPESGMAVFRLSKAGDVWKLKSVDVFEVR